MKEFWKRIWANNPRFRKVVGIILVVFGFIGIVTPFTPWGFLFFVGLGILGIRFALVEKVVAKLKGRRKDRS
ncbi:hypothetical protein KW785_02600 [Candidatus Parcubacteria bacterium]|nr:hypothetical protein [Candidatus Parcubacteria bacterium]